MDNIIHRMNALAVEMDELAASVHPSVRCELCRPMALKWVGLNMELNRL